MSLKFFFIAVFCLVFSFPVLTLAQDYTPLVQCGTTTTDPCTICDLFVLIQRVLNFLWWGVSVPLMALMLAWGGFLMIVPGSSGAKSAGSLTKGKKIITNALLGVTIAFFAWLMVDTVIKALSGQGIASGSAAETVQQLPGGFGPWNQIRCTTSSGTAPAPLSQPQSVFARNPEGITSEAARQACPTCVPPSVPIKVTNACGGNRCTIDSDLNDRLRSIYDSSLNGGDFRRWWEVTEAFPPTRVHQDSCHAKGTCVDVGLRGGAAGNPKDIVAFMQKAGQNRLTVEYEVTTETKRQTILNSPEFKNSGLPPSAVKYYPTAKIDGDHFSVYKAEYRR